ncbi:MAG: hypothetical protein AAF530_02945 [Pseudomonadota bacterium]
MKKLIWAIVPLLVGCAQARDVVFPTGQFGQHLSCDGTTQSMGHCHKKAAEVCIQGYDVVDENGRPRTQEYSGSASGDRVRNVRGGYVDTSGRTVTRDLYVVCR